MILHPNAKINLGLNIVARRADGYHDIETIFCPIPLADEMCIEEADAFSFRQEGIALDCAPEDNLVVRAVASLMPEVELPPVAIRLEKRIPSGAGLGGGSSDAAAAAVGVNALLQLGLSSLELERRLSRLGADCPFFVRNSPVFATGIGNVFTPVELSVSGWKVFVVKPKIHVSTREAYAAVKPSQPALSLTEIVRRPVAEWQQLMVNDFEPSVFAAHPEIAAIKTRLLDLGATYAAMSGSGSAVFALFDPSWTASALPSEADFPGCFCHAGLL